eukprot:4286824-Amphidinium_carterae.1
MITQLNPQNARGSRAMCGEAFNTFRFKLGYQTGPIWPSGWPTESSSVRFTNSPCHLREGDR